MSPIPDLPLLVDLVGTALLHFLWQGALIAALYAALRYGLPRLAPAWHVLMGQAAMLAFVLLPVHGVVSGWRQAVSDLPATAPVGSGPAAELLDAGMRTLAASGGTNALAWVVGLWLTGVVLLAARSALLWLRMVRIRRRASALVEPWPQTLGALAKAFGVARAVGIRESAEIETPVLFGWLQPVILLPVGLVLRLPREQVVPILLHELAHVRRLDFVFNLAETAVLTLLYYHPAVHWLARRLAQDRELACDDLVLDTGADRLAYARALAELAHERHALHTPPTPLLAATAGELLDRIERILGQRRQSARIASEPSARVLLLTVLAAILALGLMRPPLHGIDDLGLGRVFRFDIQAPALRSDPTFLLRERLSGPIPLAAREPPQPESPSRPPHRLEPLVASTLPLASPPIPVELAPPPMPAAVSYREAPVPEVTVLRRGQPEYPVDAQVRGIEGSVVLSFRIGLDGRALDLRVEQSRPAGVFEQSARVALRRWRFETLAGHDVGRRYLHTFDFRFGESGDPPGCLITLGSRICR